MEQTITSTIDGSRIIWVKGVPLEAQITLINFEVIDGKLIKIR